MASRPGIDKAPYLREVAGCYLYFFCHMLGKGHQIACGIPFSESLLTFSSSIPYEFKNVCARCKIQIETSSSSQNEQGEEAYVSRFLILSNHIVETKKGFAQLKEMVAHDLRHAFESHFGYRVVSLFLDPVFDLFRSYFGLIAGYKPGDKEPSFLHIEETHEKGVELRFTFKETDPIQDFGDVLLRFRNEWEDETARNDKQAQAVVRRLATKAGDIIAHHLRFTKLKEAGAGSALSSIGDIYIGFLCEVLSWQDIVKRIEGKRYDGTMAKGLLTGRQIKEAIR